MKNKVSVFGTSAIGSYGLLKIPINSIDPYTRTAIMGLSGIGLLLHPDLTIKSVGIGLIIGSAVNGLETIFFTGGKIVRNDFNETIYFIGENSGIDSVSPLKCPTVRIDGLTYKGLNGVFKVGNGIYVKVLSDGTITELVGLGKLANYFDNGGLKNKSWCEKIASQGDSRWLNLYERSL